MAVGFGTAQPKPEKRATTKRRRQRLKMKNTADIRVYVFGRERNICRVCRWRRADSMHELIPRSLRGRVSKRNSIAVCGDGVAGCHGHLQRHEIDFDGDPVVLAEGVLRFFPKNTVTAEWLRIKVGETIESAPMSVYEQE